MAWGRLHDKANENPKLLALSDAAHRMWSSALIYCQDKLTDGFVPEWAIHAFGVRAPNKDEIIAELCTSLVQGKGPLWHRVDGGFQLHDYLDWNDSKEEILEQRKRKAEQAQKRRSRQRSQESKSTASPATLPATPPPVAGYAGSEEPPVAGDIAPSFPPYPPISPTTGSTEELYTHTPRARETNRSAPLIPRGGHKNHAVCGIVCLPAELWERFLGWMAGNEVRLRAWVNSTLDDWQARVNRGEPPGDGNDYDFWRNRWRETFGQTEPAARSPGLQHVPDVEATRRYLEKVRSAALQR